MQFVCSEIATKTDFISFSAKRFATIFSTVLL